VSHDVKLAGAPITWGVCEVPGWGKQLDRDKVLDEIRKSGLTATELGPRGFLPDDPAEVRSFLATRNLKLVGGFVPAVLHNAAILDEELAKVEESAVILAGAGAEVLVLACETGNSGYERSVELSDEQWHTLAKGIAEVQKIGSRHGLLVTLHPHYGTVIENAGQIRRALEMTSVSLCLDTGHLMVAGADPVAIARSANGRIAHVHLKDVKASLARKVQRGEIGYRDAVKEGMYRPLGDGDVDIESIVKMLRANGYDGWFVIEQDLVIDDRADGSEPFNNAVRSVQYLESALT
jgi:inosose dehydratase